MFWYSIIRIFNLSKLRTIKYQRITQILNKNAMIRVF
jgi:hypothetical protein